MGARTDAARAEVLARREALVDEVVRLEAAGRAAVDIPAKVRRNPVRTAGLAAGSTFLALGGPQRLYRRARRAVLGPKADMPKSMLPKEIDRRLRRMGDDGERVRRVLEREFADYLEEHRKDRESRDLGATAILLAGNVLKPATERLGKQLAEQLLQPDRANFESAVERLRTRRRETGKGDRAAAQGDAAPAAASPPGDSGPAGSSGGRAVGTFR